MAEQPIQTSYDEPLVAAVENEVRAPRPVRGTPRSVPAVNEATRPAERKLSYFATLDKPILVVVSMLLAVGLLMVFSTTFDWSFQNWGSPTVKFMEHVRNVGIGLVGLVIMSLIDYRMWRRFAVWILLVTIGALIAVLIFGDDTFGARRSLIRGSLQPGELAEFAVVIYMAAWLSSKNTKIRSITYGLIPFAVLIGIIGALLMLQPDLSTAAIVFITSGTMFFLAGADTMQLLFAGITAGGVGWVLAQRLSYAQDRVQSFVTGIVDITQANYQTQQAIIAFSNGGWLGVGIGGSSQKFGFLPAAHTDSIFAIIGEELGIVGAGVVILLYIAFVMRGFQIARRAQDPFGALLAAGLTIWVITQAILNIAVMLGLVPSTGLPLPFISFGGSSMAVLLAGVGLLLSIQRVSANRYLAPERRNDIAYYDRSRRNRRPRVSRAGRGGSDEAAQAE